MVPFPYKQILTIFFASIYVVYCVNIVYTNFISISYNPANFKVSDVCATRHFYKPHIQAQSINTSGCMYCTAWTNFSCSYANTSSNGVVSTNISKSRDFDDFICLPFYGTYDSGIDVNCTLLRVRP